MNRSLITKVVFLGFTLCLPLSAQNAALRVWTNQQGRTLKAALVSVNGAQVVLQLENGTKSQVAISTLSAADQDFIAKSGSTRQSSPVTANAALGWSDQILEIKPKSLVVTEGKQDASSKRYHYNIENFEFVATAPLANSVMSEVAADFLLSYRFFQIQPWGWLPKPKTKARYLVYLAETPEEYIEMGGPEQSSATLIEDDVPLIKFSTLGLKKVGARYQFDARSKEPGGSVSIVSRGILDTIYPWLYPFTHQGLAYFIQYAGYQPNGTMMMKNVESTFKKSIKELTSRNNLKLDSARLMKYIRSASRDLRSDVLQYRYEYRVDALLAFYFFAHLDGDGSGSALHQYYKYVVARAGLANDAEAAKAMLEAKGLGRASPEELIAQLLAGRSDPTLIAEMKMKFDKIGIHLD